MRRTIKNSVMVFLLALPAIVIAQEQSFSFDIPAQALGSALRAFAHESRQQVVFENKTVEGKQSAAIKGTYTALDALARLLAGTGLSAQKGASGLYIVRDPTASESVVPTRSAPADPDGSARGGAGETSATPADTAQLEAVIVTAQKREERLQDVPVPVTAISAGALIDSNQVRLQDYFTRIPGLSVTPEDSNGAPIITIRGVTTGALGNPTVGIVVDDVSLGSSGSLGLQVPDLDPSDLSQIEVLRGPQGTLYGASSIGGLIKYVTIDPSTERLSGRVQGGVSDVSHGDGAGYNLRAAVNVPLGGTLAVRASGFVRRDPGYIDDPALGARGVNRLTDNGGRFAALWRPSEQFSLKLSAALQHETAYGSSNAYVMPGLGDLQQKALGGTGYFDDKVQVYTAIVKAKLGLFDLVSVSGYNVHKYSDIIDYTPFFGQINQAQFGVSGSPLFEDIKTSKFTQEVRLTAPLGSRAEWLIGAFYNHENSPNTQQLLATDPVTGAVAGTFLFDSAPQKFEEYAAFTDLTYHFTDRFDVQFGGRESQNRQSSYVEYQGPYASLFLGASPTLYPTVHTKDDSFTYLVTPRFRVSPDLMVYARLASGYRPGGPNVNAAAFGLPASYDADKTKNYEIGVKGDALNHSLSYDASIYYIDWKNIQLILVDATSGSGYYTNAGGAKSQGVELSVESRPLTGLTLSAWAAYNNAALIQAFPATSTAFGRSGDRLPFSSRVSGNVGIDQEFPLTGNIRGFAGGSISYVGDRQGVFTSTANRQNFPSYARTDLRAGLKRHSWTVNLFINNAADRRAALNGGVGTLSPIAFNYIQPRTIGISVAETF
jgi:iron complex outermembrane receptor protein